MWSPEQAGRRQRRIGLNAARGLAFVLICGLLLIAAGCGENMRRSGRIEPLARSDFFPDGQSARPVISGTLALGMAGLDEQLVTGQVGGQAATTFPFTVTRDVLLRGRVRYEVYCAPCHGLMGDGQGMIVQRGFSPPPSFHQQRLRDAPPGYIFNVITNGLGRMYSYAERVEPADRWAIIAYIRALQLSQNATIDDVPPEERGRLEGAGS